MFGISFEKSQISFPLSITLPIFCKIFPFIPFLRHDKGNCNIPCISLFVLTSNPIINEIFSIPNLSHPCGGIMACKHSELALVKLIQLRFHSLWGIMKRDLVLVPEQINIFFSFFLIYVVFPLLKHINSSTLIIRACKSILIVPISLAIHETH